jgi:hypothetical protein
MKLDFSQNGQVKITMIDYVNKILEAFNKAKPNGTGSKASVAPDDLFQEKIARS